MGLLFVREYGSDCFCSIISMRLRCVYLKIMASVSSSVISNNCLFLLQLNRYASMNSNLNVLYKERLSKVMFTKCHCLLGWAGELSVGENGFCKGTCPSPSYLVSSSLFIQTESFHLVIIDRGFLNHLPVTQICKISCCY